MDVKCELSLPERIMTVQKQLRIAIQNYQLMLQRKQLLENRIKNDEKFQPHLEVIQFIILNLGKTQASLLNQYRNELATKHNLSPNDNMITHIIKSNLSFPDTPKNIPVFKAGMKRKVLKLEAKPIPKTQNKETSSDKTDNNATSKHDSYYLEFGKKKILNNSNKKNDQKSILVDTKKLLKPKIDDVKSEKDREKGNQSPVSVSSLSSLSSSGSECPEDDLDLPYSPPPYLKLGKKYSPKLLSAPAISKRKTIIDQPTNKTLPAKEIIPSGSYWKDGLDWAPFPTPVVPPRAVNLQQLDENPTSIYDLGKIVYMGSLCLASQEKFEQLSRKRCERKRRSVAGQNSLYSDYLQPLPKRSYGARKPAVLVPPPALVLPPPQPPTAPIDPPPPPAQPTNAVIVESLPPDDDDEDKEKPVCVLCSEGIEKGALESCYGCHETFHFQCLPPDQKEICPSQSCMAQRKISNIVGANVSSGNACDLELVMRYSSEENTPEIRKEIEEAVGGSSSS